LDDELDPDLSDETYSASGSESPPTSTVQNTSQATSSGPTTDERSQNTINSGVSDDEFGAMTLDTDTVGNMQGEPEPVLTVTRKPVRLPSACTHCRF
jgi:hypothetical protein